MSKKAAETTIKTSIRIRPCSEKEKEQYAGPCQVQAAAGEVRLYPKSSVTNRTAGGARESSPSGIRRPSTPTHRPGTPTAVGSAAAQAVWQAVAMQQQLGSDYQSYPFANVFGPEMNNEEVYNGSGCRDIVESVLGGCNGTIFVYGQTGAGKTHTMDAFTQLVMQQLYAAAARDDSNCEISITVSAVELYNEVLRCLLSGRENLQLRMGAAAPGAGTSQGIMLDGADERACSTCQEAAAVVELAKSNRSVGETRANARSSRSHLIVRIKVETLQLGNNLSGAMEPAAAKAVPSGPASVSFSLLNLVDLAGSERVDKSGSSDTPLRLREALNINKSLLCLGNVVTALAERSEGRKSTHIPYRDSKLTRLLEDSLGGNAATALVACITPLPEWHLEQTRATLEFAARAARVVCSPQKNVLKLGPNPAASDSSDLIAQLQAEVAQLKSLLAQHQREGTTAALATTAVAAGQTGKLQSSTWDSCSSSSSGAMADAAAAAEAAVGEGCAAVQATSPLSRSKWTHRLRLSVNGAAAARAAAAAAAANAGARATRSTIPEDCTVAAVGDGSTAAAVQLSSGEQLVSGAQHRSNGSSLHHGSLLWKFFHHGRSVSAVDKLPPLTETGNISGVSANLRSTGLLMLPAGAKHGFCSSGGGASNSSSGGVAVGGQHTGPGMLSRCGTFHHSSNGGSNSGSEAVMFAKMRSSSCGGGAGQVVSGSFRAGSTSGGGSQVSTCIDGGSNSITSHMAATEAAMALRDHIIKQLVTALQQKKSEIKALREQQANFQRQLEAAEGDGIASKQKLRELAEGIQALAAAREEEFEKWKGHLEGVEVALQAAQQESLTYRQEALALVQQLTQLQARYRSLQSDQLRRSSILQSTNQGILTAASQKEPIEQMQLQKAALQQSSQLQRCLTTLLAIEECLRQLLTHAAAPLSSIHSGVAVADSSAAAGGDSQHTAASAATGYSCASSAMKGEISSHMIQTVSTRYDMSSGLVTRATNATTGNGKTHVQLEDTLNKLTGVIPLLCNAAAYANSAAVNKPSPVRDSGKEHLSFILSGNSADSDGSEKIKAAHGTVYSVPPPLPAKCHKCDSLKPLLALMQKLKDEVAQLRCALKAQDAELAAAVATSATVKLDLEESRQQVGSLQERIDELAEELEAARAAAAGAAPAGAAAGAKQQTPAESAAAADAAGHVTTSFAVTLDTVESPGDMFSPGAQLSRQCSTSRVPLMSVDTPLSELHAQILMSWHVLAMPRTYRAAFVLGHGMSLESAPWSDRSQCQAHVALLACLHQLQEDQPLAAATQQSILSEEATLLDAGLSRMPQTDFDALMQQWGILETADAATQRLGLLQQMWAPCAAGAADQLATASAAACRQCLASAPPVEMAALTIRSNASLMAATSNALAEAAS